jgi:hypothetical protein
LFGVVAISRLIRKLFGDEWFTDTVPIGVDSKVVIEQTAGAWGVELAELIGGPGAFIITVSETSDFEAAIRRKLLREILARSGPLQEAAAEQGLPRPSLPPALGRSP